MPDVIYYHGISLIKDPRYKHLSEKISLLSNIWKIGVVNRLQPDSLPFRHSIMFPTADYSSEFNLTYKDCAMSRIEDLDAIHKKTNYPIRLFYSGGLDSTMMFACLIEYYGMDRAKDIIEIYCSKESIIENPWLWDRYIRPNNFKLSSSTNHSHSWQDPVLSVVGEFNDQLMGGEPQMMKWVNFRKGNDICATPDLALLIKYFGFAYYQCNNSDIRTNFNNARIMAEDLVESSRLAPYKIENFFQMFSWWGHLNYWHGKYFAMMSSTKDTKLDTDFFDNKYFQFFFSEKFQQWSVNYNRYKTIDDIDNRKHFTKQLISEYLDIPEYDNKQKVNSWPGVNNFIPGIKFIDSEFNIHHTWDNFDKFIK